MCPIALPGALDDRHDDITGGHGTGHERRSEAGTEVAGLIGAERHERTNEGTAYRNGSRSRTWDTGMAYDYPRDSQGAARLNGSLALPGL